MLVDAIGQRFEPAGAEKPQRIVSLVPSLTETLFAYGAGEAITGVTRYCVEPVAALHLPKVGGTKNPDLPAIRALRPDLVLASAEENRKEDVEALISGGLRVFVTLPTTVAGALAMLADLARLIGAESVAAPLLSATKATLAEVGTEAAASPPVPYFCPIWRRPYMACGAGTYAHDLLRACGGVSVCDGIESSRRYFAVSLDSVAAARPRIILLPDEPYPFAERHKADFAAFSTVPAVAQGALHCIDGKLLTWYGPRTERALRTLRALLRGS